MNFFRLTLEVRSPLGTPLSSDTLWGHIAWGVRHWQGEAALVDWLQRYDNQPPLVLGDPLPAGFWPRPEIPSPPHPDSPPTKVEADGRKALARVRYVSHTAWRILAGQLGSAELLAALSDRDAPQGLPVAYADTVVHAGINRLTGGTAQESGGSLYSVERTFYAGPTQFDVWGLSPADLREVQTWFEQGLVSGYGRDASQGAGQIAVGGIEAAQPPRVAGANAAVALGPFVPRPGDPVHGFFRAAVRCGRLGGDFAVGLLPESALSRQKRPVAVFEAGAVLTCPAGPPNYVGRVLRGIHPELPWIRQYALSPLLPCRLDERLVRFTQAQRVADGATALQVSP